MRRNEIIINRKYPGLNPVVFGFEDCEPRHSYGPAVRPYWLFHYVVAGTGKFHRDGKIYTLKKGEIFVIPPYLETYYEADNEDPWHYIWIGFTAESDLVQILDLPVIRAVGLGHIFEEMKLCLSLENGKSAYLSAKLWELYSALLETGKAENDYVEKALHCIREEYMTDLSVEELARRLNLDRSYFSGLFREKMGTPPGRYLHMFRLEKAAELMVKHKMSPSTAALSVGFSDLYHFSKAFKKHFGTSPRAWCNERLI
ncbi:MAG: AraC family transcriptional regulator [Clostridia bacterium]|nr:AraC family transcriptional regulator [Clostridia bacterium]